MQTKLKRFVLLAALLLYCGSPVRAGFQNPDTLYSETFVPDDSVGTDSAYAAESYEEDEEEEPRVIVYNKQMPSEGRWLEASSDDAYTYRTKREYVKRPPPPPPREVPGWIRFLQALVAFFSSFGGKVLLWILFLALAGFIIYRIVAAEGGLFARRDLRPEAVAAPAELSEDGLMELNWESRMREALAAGDPRMAIRFAYLHLLQQLQTRELIRFRADKTNIAYYRELPEAQRPGFRALTRSYEYAWYGNFPPDTAGMQQFLNNFEQYLLSLPRL